MTDPATPTPPAAQPKKAYHPPVVQDFGSIEEITRSATDIGGSQTDGSYTTSA